MQNKPSAFDRFFNGGKKPSDAMDLAIADAIHAKLETADALMEYRDAHTALIHAIEILLPYAESRANAEQIHGWASRSQAAVESAREAMRRGNR